MHGSRKFFFFWSEGVQLNTDDVGREDPSNIKSELFRWRFAGGTILAQHLMLVWQLCDFPGNYDQYY